jgi:dipeptidyl aminopeptidase/acylaminoacyl peptidase
LKGISIITLEDGRSIEVSLPNRGSPGFPSWAPDGRRFLFTMTFDDGIELWICNVSNGRARSLTNRSVNGLGPRPRWMPDGVGILVAMISGGRGTAPEKSIVPTGPVIQQNLGGKAAPVRTYQDLLDDPYEEVLFEHYFTSQLTLVDSQSGETTPIGSPGIFIRADPSPTGDHFLVDRIRAPYSYLVPIWRFGRDVEIWDERGSVIRKLAEVPLGERVPIQGVVTGPRSHFWRDTVNREEVLWLEALDGGDPNVEAGFRDRLLLLAAPFEGTGDEIFRFEDRFSYMQFIEQSSYAIASEYDRDERWSRTWLFVPGDDSVTPKVIHDRSVRDRYADPGDPIMTINRSGRRVILQEGGSIYLAGQGASPDGDRPFIDRWTLETIETERLWRAQGENYEAVVDLTNRDGTSIITRYETPATPPNFYVRQLDADDRTAITQFEHPAAELLGINKQLVKYAREDGVELSATLYTPLSVHHVQRRFAAFLSATGLCRDGCGDYADRWPGSRDGQ